MNKKLWWHYLKTIVLVMRVIAFEKFGVVAALVWWTFIAFLVLVSVWVHYAVALAIVVLGIVLHGWVQGYLMDKKYLLIRKGDSVEYTLPDEKEGIQQFSTGRVLYRMRPADVANTSLFNPDHLDLYDHFYLVDTGKKNIVIPYEWIITIETGELEL